MGIMRVVLVGNPSYSLLPSDLNWMICLLELTTFLQPRAEVKVLDSKTFQVPPIAFSRREGLGQMNEMKIKKYSLARIKKGS